jgi:hypothetical protein
MSESEATTSCEICGAAIPPSGVFCGGFYEVVLVRKDGSRVSWRFDKIVCVMEFARNYAHLDIALQDDEGGRWPD